MALVSSPQYFGERPNAAASEFFEHGPRSFACTRSQQAAELTAKTAQQYLNVLLVETVEDMQNMTNDAHLSALRMCFKGDEATYIPSQLKLLLRFLGISGTPHEPPAPAGALLGREALGVQVKPEWQRSQSEGGKGGEDNTQNFMDCNKRGQVSKSTLPLPPHVIARMRSRIQQLQEQEGTQLKVHAVRARPCEPARVSLPACTPPACTPRAMGGCLPGCDTHFRRHCYGPNTPQPTTTHHPPPLSKSRCSCAWRR